MRSKGIAWMFPLTIGIILLAVGVVLMYILPEYIMGALTETGTFNETLIQTARDKVETVQNLAIVVITIGMVWILIGIVGGAKGVRGK